jgi:hypothetical protein
VFRQVLYLPKSLAGGELVIDPERSASDGMLDDPSAIPELLVNASQVRASSDAV